MNRFITTRLCVAASLLLCVCSISNAATIGDVEMPDQPVSALAKVKSAKDALEQKIVQVKLIQHTDGSKVYACAIPNAPGLSVKLTWQAHGIDNERDLNYDSAKPPSAGKYVTNGTVVCWPPDEADQETSLDMVVQYKGNTASHTKVCPAFEGDATLAPDVPQTDDTLTHVVITRVDFQQAPGYTGIQPIVHYRNEGMRLADRFYIQAVSYDPVTGETSVGSAILGLKPDITGVYMWNGIMNARPGTYAMTFYVVPFRPTRQPLEHVLTRQRRGPSFTCTFTVAAPPAEN